MGKEYILSVDGDENLLTFKWFSINALGLFGLSTGKSQQKFPWLVNWSCSGKQLGPPGL